MQKWKRVLLICLLLFAVLIVGLYYLIMGLEWTKWVWADCYVNGEKLEMPAAIYWYGYTPLASFPLVSTLESLGCHIEQEEINGYPHVIIHAGSREFVINSVDLYKDDTMLVFNAVRKEVRGGRNVRGQLFMDDHNYEAILKALGFKQITCEIDEEALVVKLNAVRGW